MGKAECGLTCPKCHEPWARFRYELEKDISDVRAVVGKKKKKFKKGEAITCSLCGHEHTNWDIVLAIHADLAKRGELGDAAANG